MAINTGREKLAADVNSDFAGEQEGEQERVPIMQQILDNPFLLLFIGVAVPTVFYTVWGIMEVVTIPIAK
ncbi:hypothetical protein EGT07_10705 [Herbaspirillum sp. HC18]|nr:hypothetical protein EGT07_10705 [Herbaspirillum sp. HC18]